MGRDLLIPLLIGFMIFGLAGGWLSDRLGPRGLSTGGHAVLGFGFIALSFLPADFDYLPFASLLFLVGASFGIFSSPNTTAVMNALPGSSAAWARACARPSRMRAAPQHGSVLQYSGNRAEQPVACRHQTNLVANGIPADAAIRAANIPPTGALFASFLGYNPINTLLGPEMLAALPAAVFSFLRGGRYVYDEIKTPNVVFAEGGPEASPEYVVVRSER